MSALISLAITGFILWLMWKVVVGFFRVTFRLGPKRRPPNRPAGFYGQSSGHAPGQAVQRPAGSNKGLPRWQGQRAAASGHGAMSGYEPRDLDHRSVPRNPLVFGTPAGGLATAGFSAASTKAGTDGEVRFAKALDKAGLADRVASFWSVGMPAATGSKVKRGSTLLEDARFGTDIDCVLYTGTTIYLVDLKNYRSGAITYFSSRDGSHLVALDDATGELVGEVAHPSRNMAMAHQRFQQMFPNKRVESRIVFVPRDEGEATFRNVRWPGGIPAVRLSEFLYELSNVCQPKERVQAVLPQDMQVAALRNLLRS